MATVDVFNFLPDAVCVVDTSGYLLRFNAIFRSVVNLKDTSPHDKIPNFLDELIHRESRPLFIDAFESLLNDVRDTVENSFSLGLVRTRLLNESNSMRKISSKINFATSICHFF